MSEIMDRLGIPVPTQEGELFTCPMCQAKRGLSVTPDEALGYWWCCTVCFSSGNAEKGWDVPNRRNRDYLTVEDLSDELEEVWKNGFPRGVPTEWPSVTELYSVRRGEWTLITGMPGHGKSEFLDSLLVALSVDHGWKIGMFSPENLPHKLHAVKLIEKMVGKSATPGRPERMDKDSWDRAMRFLEERFYWVDPPRRSLDDILATCEVLVRRHLVDGIVIDPWNEIEHQRPGELSETEYVSLVLSRLRSFAREREVHVWLIAHPTKLIKDKSGKYPVPRPYDVAGSAHFYNKADNCLSVWRDSGAEDEEQRNTVEIHIQKVRFKMTGKVGMAELRYDRPSGRFFDPEDKSEPGTALSRWLPKSRQ